MWMHIKSLDKLVHEIRQTNQQKYWYLAHRLISTEVQFLNITRVVSLGLDSKHFYSDINNSLKC